MSSPLLDWASKGQLSRIVTAIDSGQYLESTDPKGRTALMRASLAEHEDVVRVLLEASVDVNRQATYYGWTALAYAAQANHIGVVLALLEHNADHNAKAERGKTPLVLAADRGHASIVAALLEKGANPDPAPDHHGWTPLSRAVRKGHLEVVRVLLDACANPLAQNYSHGTPLSIARWYRHTEIADLMNSVIRNAQ